jgi:hypothetical protein
MFSGYCALAVWVALVGQTSVTGAETQLTVSDHDRQPVLVWVKPWHEPRWPEPVSLDPGQSKTFRLRGRGSADVRVRYYMADGSLVDRTVMAVNVESLADLSRARPGRFTITAESRITTRWLKQDGAWARARVPRESWPWTFYGEQGQVRLDVPQDAAHSATAGAPSSSINAGANSVAGAARPYDPR